LACTGPAYGRVNARVTRILDPSTPDRNSCG
jgi:hypothetical protein